jgi:transcriptional regulator with XRE-family HTH domain
MPAVRKPKSALSAWVVEQRNRQDPAWKSEELARRLGVAESTVRGWESGRTISPANLVALEGVPGFALNGIADTLGATIGLGTLAAAAAVACIVIARPTRWRTPVTISCAAGLLAEFVAIGLVREGFSDPGTSHYLYVGAMLVLPAAAVIVPSVRVKALAPALFAVALGVNTLLLVVHGLGWVAETNAQRAAGSDVPPAGVCTTSDAGAHGPEAVVGVVRVGALEPDDLKAGVVALDAHGADVLPR